MEKDIYSVATAVADFIAKAKETTADGLTVGEFFTLTGDLLRLVVYMLDSIPGDGQAKKEYAMAATGYLFDAIADRAVPTVAWPFWLVFRGPARSFTVAAAGGLVETILPLVRAIK